MYRTVDGGAAAPGAGQSRRAPREGPNSFPTPEPSHIIYSSIGFRKSSSPKNLLFTITHRNMKLTVSLESRHSRTVDGGAAAPGAGRGRRAPREGPNLIPNTKIISYDVFTDLFQRVNSSTKLSIYDLLLLINI